jgi:hypothetical protein
MLQLVGDNFVRHIAARAFDLPSLVDIHDLGRSSVTSEP